MCVEYYILKTARWSHRPYCIRTYSRRTNHLTTHTYTCRHAMSTSAAGVSSACFQQEKWSGVGFDPIVFRVHNANLSPYLRNFPRREKTIKNISDFQFAFSRAGKKQNNSDFQFTFDPGRKKAKRPDFQFAFSRPGKKQNGSDFEFIFFQVGKKTKWFRLPFCFFPGRKKKQNNPDFQFAFSRPGKKQNISGLQFRIRPGNKQYLLDSSPQPSAYKPSTLFIRP